MRRVKIVCTLGPATSSYEAIRELAEGGMNVARLNFSHGTHADHRRTYDLVRRVSDDLGQPIAILQDLQGPKIRVGKFADGPVQLENGQPFTIVGDDEMLGNREKVGTTYTNLPQDVSAGDIILLDDGLLRFRVEEVVGNEVRCVVEVGWPGSLHFLC